MNNDSDPTPGGIIETHYMNMKEQREINEHAVDALTYYLQPSNINYKKTMFEEADINYPIIVHEEVKETDLEVLKKILEERIKRSPVISTSAIPIPEIITLTGPQANTLGAYLRGEPDYMKHMVGGVGSGKTFITNIISEIEKLKNENKTSNQD